MTSYTCVHYTNDSYFPCLEAASVPHDDQHTIPVEYSLRPWSKKELKSLQRCAKKLKKTHKSWNSIYYLREAEVLFGRSPQECQGKWERDDRSALSKNEQQRLDVAVAQYRGRDWQAIARAVGGRSTPASCFAHYRRSNRSGSSKKSGKWDSEETTMLKDAVQQYGKGSWSQVSQCVPGRSTGQCYAQWKLIECTDKLNEAWSIDENRLLLLAVRVYGEDSRWGAVAHCVKTRNGVQCKLQWFACLKHTLMEAEVDDGDDDEESGSGGDGNDAEDDGVEM